MTGQEAHFVTAVAAHRRSQPILKDAEYQSLKVCNQILLLEVPNSLLDHHPVNDYFCGLLQSDLASKGSWVVNRAQDPLERLGLDTFMGYLHSAM